MEGRNNSPLQHRSQIDQQIAAAHQVQVREWRILHQVLLGEDAHIPDRLVDLKSSIQPYEESLQSLRRNLRDRCLSVKAGAGAIERPVAEVGGKNLDRSRCLRNVP